MPKDHFSLEHSTPLRLVPAGGRIHVIGVSGVAMAQLGVEPERMTKVFERWTGWLKERPETVDYLARPKGSRAKRHV